MPRGKKQCPNCNSLQAVRALCCSECGTEFQKKSTLKKKVSFFKERKDFIRRMLNDGKSSNYKLDMMTASKVFKMFDNDLDFLTKVKPPFNLNDSIKYFLTKDGQDYLRKKKLEFEYKPDNSEKIVDHSEKVGEDVVTSRKRTLRDFLNDE